MLNQIQIFKLLKPKALSFLSIFFMILIFSNDGYSNSNFFDFTVKGNVKDSKTGEALIGATLLEKNTKNGTITDYNGDFSITVSNDNAVLVVSYIGYESLEVPVNNSSNLEIKLNSDTKVLEQVVVIGYGTQKVTRVSGAISSVKESEVQRLKPVRLEESIQGRASGVNVVQGGSPGSKPTVLIRGIPSYTGTEPVVVVDGVIQSIDDLSAINSADIESINVLKDAATTAIYGVKGGNGVIVVTTKSGKKGKDAEISLNTYYGIQEVQRTISMLNATEYGIIMNEGSTSSGGELVFKDINSLGTGTNWQNEVFKKAAIQSYNLSASGSSDKINYFVSGGYLGQGGIVGGTDKSNFNRLNGTVNLGIDLTSKLKLIVNTSYTNIKNKGIQENSFNSILGSALNYDPTVPVLNTDTSVVSKYGYSKKLLSEILNPLTKLANTYNVNDGDKLYGKVELQYEILKDLRFTSRLGYTNFNQIGKSFTPLVFWGVNNVENSLDSKGNQVDGRHNSVNEYKNSASNYNFENFFNYNFDADTKNHFETVLGMSISKVLGDGFSESRQDVPFNSWEFADITSATGVNTATNTSAFTASNYQYFRKNLSYFGRLIYEYDNKYLASLSTRRDGSFAFGTKNKFGNFLSGSLGWIVSSEDFFKNNFVDYLKIRGSYGITGNENVSPQFVSIVSGGPNYSDVNNNGYTFGSTFFLGSTVGSFNNDGLKWERQKQANIGFDMYFWKSKFNLTADYFQRSVDGLLFQSALSLYLGTARTPDANIGSTKTSGVDLTLGYNDNFGKDFKFNTSITFTKANNLVTKTNEDSTSIIFGGGYFNGASQNVTRFQAGYEPGYFFGYKTDGLFQYDGEVLSAPTQNGARAGDIKYVDMNKDGVINDRDKTKIGSPFPDFTMGWNLGLQYKNFDFSVYTYLSYGNEVFKAFDRNSNFTNKERAILNRWTEPLSTNDAKNPRYSFLDPNSNNRVSDRYVEDGSFVKIKNIQLGYSLSPDIFKNKIIKNLRVYFQVKNAFTFTKYTGFDPEIPGGIFDTGVDRGAYPQARTWAIGLDAKF